MFNNIKNFVSDGCTYAPDGDFHHCCVEHDLHYHTGDVSRRQADKQLRRCVIREGEGNFISKAIHMWLGWVYWAAVRLFASKRYNKK